MAVEVLRCRKRSQPELEDLPKLDAEAHERVSAGGEVRSPTVMLARYALADARGVAAKAGSQQVVTTGVGFEGDFSRVQSFRQYLVGGDRIDVAKEVSRARIHAEALVDPEHLQLAPLGPPSTRSRKNKRAPRPPSSRSATR